MKIEKKFAYLPLMATVHRCMEYQEGIWLRNYWSLNNVNYYFEEDAKTELAKLELIEQMKDLQTKN